MNNFAVHFEFNDPPEVHDEPRFQLEGATLVEAKLEAAVLFAAVVFGTPPQAYRIFQHGEIEVYRYPERGRVAGNETAWDVAWTGTSST